MTDPCEYCVAFVVCNHLCTEKILFLCQIGELNIQYFPSLREEYTKRKTEMEEEKDAWKIPVAIV